MAQEKFICRTETELRAALEKQWQKQFMDEDVKLALEAYLKEDGVLRLEGIKKLKAEQVWPVQLEFLDAQRDS